MSEYYSLYILEANNPKKCRARYGLDRQQEWCKPCRYCTTCTLRISGDVGGIVVSACVFQLCDLRQIVEADFHSGK